MPVKIFVPGLGNVPIPDEIPLEKTEEYVNSLAKQQGVELPRPAPPEQNIFERTLEAGIGGTKRLLSSQATALQSPFDANKAATEGIERQKAITERPGADLDELTRVYKEKGFLPAAGELVSQIPPAIAEQAPFLAEMYAGAKAGAALPVPPQLRPFTAVGGAFAAPLLSAFGSGTERQVAEQQARGEEANVDTGKAMLAAVPSAALDVVEGRIAFGRGIIGKILGKTDEEIAAASKAATEKELRKLAKEGVLGSIARGTGKTAAFEMPAEVAQQALERWQAGLPLTGDEAYQEYAEAAYGAGLVSPIGSIGRLSEKGIARNEIGRRQAIEEFEARTPNVPDLVAPSESTVPPERVSSLADSFISNTNKEVPSFGLDYIVKNSGDEVANDGDAAVIANELFRRGEIVQEGGTPEAPTFRFLSDDEKIVPHLDSSQPYLYASPAVRQNESKPEGYEVSNSGINVTRKAKTEEEAEQIKSALDARVKRATDELDTKIKKLNEQIAAVQENLSISIASDISEEELSVRHDEAAGQINSASQEIAQLEEQRSAIAKETEVNPIGGEMSQESGYEVRLYRPGQNAKTLVPFANREQAEQFILQNATPAQQQAIFEDQAEHRGGLREAQRQMYMPGESAPETSPEATGKAVEQTEVPEPTPEMQERVQAVTSRLKGVLDQMGLKNVGLKVSNKLEDMVNGKLTPVDGYYLNKVINVSLSSSRGVMPTFGHETIHALREMGMFSDKEWDVLSRKAKDEWIKKYGTEERYSHLSPEEQIEEAIADAFGFWMSGEYKPTGVIRGLLNRIKLFIESVGSVFRGQGFDNSEKVFQRALAGELEGGVERKAEGKQYAQRKPEHTHVVVDPRNNNKIMGYYKGLSNANRGKDRLDNAYGGYRYRVEKIAPEDKRFALPRTIEVDGKERPTTNSEGRKIHPTEEGIRNFWRWFGNSKVVDEQGRPIVMYHGTQAIKDFDSFYIGYDGAKFTTDPEYASGWAGGEEPEWGLEDEDSFGGRVIPAYLKVENFAPEGVDFGFPGAYKKRGYDGSIITHGDGSTWVTMYDAKNIKSAVGNLGTFKVSGPGSKKIQYALSLEDYENLSPEARRVMEEDFLYSPLNRLIANAPKKLDGQPSKGWLQWLNANAHMAGGKDGELFWTGLDEWLVNQSGQKISKERIAEYLSEFDNPRDVVYEAYGRPEIGVIDVTDQLPELVDPNGNPVNAAYEFIVTVGGQDFSFIAYEHNDEMYPYALYNTNDEYINSFSDIDSIKEDIAYEANESLGIQGNTKYSQYVLDGGDNYREIPVVLSGPSAKKIVFNFYNTHFPDANVLYHLRTNDRQDVDGNNVLFIEEVQSDWAQKGREAGFTQTQEERLERQRKIKELEDNLYLINEMLNEATIKEDRESLIALRKDLRDKQDKLEPIPVGPYIQDTGKWVELAAKRIIAMAVNGGYDKVAFINPSQAHARFPEKKDGGSTKEGFENFYGKILPNKLNSLLKKYGSKVEVIELPVEGDASKWATDSDTSQQLGFVVTSELADSVRKNGFPKHALPMKVLAQGKRKPTTSSTGAQIHPTKNGVRNFWRWFGDGELVDSMGRPRMFYHGSLKDIEAFKRGTADAIFFAPSPEPMNVFINYKVTQDAYNEKPYAFGAVYPVYINAKNVFDYENPEHVDALVDEVMKNAKLSTIGLIRKAILHPYYSVKMPTENGVEEKFLVAPEAIVGPKEFSRAALKEKLQQGNWPTFETGEVINALKRLGFDGFHVQEDFGGRFYKNVAVFSPNNIKSAVGNNGQFSPNDKRTQHALQMPKTKISQAINRASKQDSLRQDPLFATPFSSPAAGINVLNYGMNNTPTIKDNKNFIQRAITNNSGKLYSLFQLSGLVDVFGDKIPPLRAYYNSIRTMMGGRDIYIHESSKLADEWQRLNARSLKDGNDMATVMNRSTYYRYDPSIGKKPQTKEEVEIQRMYDALPAPYKKLYLDVKNFYRNRFDQFFKLLEKRVAKSVTDPARAKVVLEEIKKKYNYYKQIEPYFPLTRFGEYWVRYKEDGQEKFEMFENASDQDTFKNKIMSTPGVTDVTNGKKLITLRGDIGASDFVNNIMDSLDAAKGGQMGMAEIEDMKDSVWQLYLSSLPELSMRKQFMHRANVPGYSNDALRAFQKNAFHGAYHMARLEHAPEVYGKLNDVRKYVVDLQEKNHPDAVSASELYNSVASEQRQKQIWRPDDTTTPFRIAGQVGFLYYLSSAASAVTNLTQNLTHAFPIIGAEFGYDKSAKEFARAYKQFFESPSLDDFSDIKKSKSLADAALQTDRGIRSVFDITRTLEQLKSEAKTQKDKDKYQREIDAINYLYQTVISRSQAMDLAGATDKVTVSSHWSQVGMRFIAMAFHGAEILNRTTTGIVAYRLQMEKLEKEQRNLSPEQRHEIAVRRASEIVDQSHYNYSEANRSPFMGNLGQMGKVIFMFKSYAIAETTFLFNTFRVWSKVLRDRWKGTPLEQKAIDDSRKARRTLIGVLGMQGMFAGVLGLPTPLMMIVMALANSIGGGDDDEEDIPAKVEFKQWLVETFGDNLAQAIAYGPASYVTGADFNSRVGLNNLWFRDPNPAEDELDQTKNFLLNLGGPMVGLTTNFVQGITLMNQGEIGRGFEKMVPNIVKAPIQARRFMNEGATTVKGDQILDEFSTQELGLTFFGFTPTRLSLAYQQQSEQRGAMFQANLDKKRVLIKFNLAAKSNDFDALEDIEKDIERYNKKYPSDPITFDTLRRSLKATAAAQKETQHGLRIPKKQRAIAEGVSWLDWEKLEED